MQGPSIIPINEEWLPLIEVLVVVGASLDKESARKMINRGEVYLNGKQVYTYNKRIKPADHITTPMRDFFIGPDISAPADVRKEQEELVFRLHAESMEDTMRNKKEMELDEMDRLREKKENEKKKPSIFDDDDRWN